jgi:hypothetical protein
MPGGGAKKGAASAGARLLKVMAVPAIAALIQRDMTMIPIERNAWVGLPKGAKKQRMCGEAAWLSLWARLWFREA